MSVTLEVVDPGSMEVQQILVRHLTFTNETSPPEDVHALDTDGLRDQSVTLYGARLSDGTLAGIGALKRLDDRHAELKSMHVVAEARGRGIGRSIVAGLLETAEQRGYTRLSLETGSMQEFAAARALYRSFGFAPCEPFADYRPSPNSAYFTLELRRPVPS